MSKLKSLTFDAPTGTPGSLPAALLRRRLHPVEVQGWFLKATGERRRGRGPAIAPPQEIAADLANKITSLAVGGPLDAFHETALDSMPFVQLDRPRNERIATALSTLRTDLPGWLDGYKTPESIEAQKFMPKWATRLKTQLALVSTLRDVVLFIERERIFSQYLPTMGHPRAWWHGVALFLGPDILAALQASGIKQAGFGNATAPAVAILKSALGWLGADHKEETIVKAMRPPRPKKRKQVA